MTTVWRGFAFLYPFPPEAARYFFATANDTRKRRGVFGKQSKSIGFAKAYWVLMRTVVHSHAFNPKVETFYPIAESSKGLVTHDQDSASDREERALHRAFCQLVWVLIALLLLLYLGTSYLFWAKIESAWPIAR